VRVREFIDPVYLLRRLLARRLLPLLVFLSKWVLHGSVWRLTVELTRERGASTANQVERIVMRITCLRTFQLLRIEAMAHTLDHYRRPHPNGLLLRKRRFS